MIANLKGMYETVEYTGNRFIQLYDNTDVEAYPRHWHSCIELIMPIRGDYIVEYDSRKAVLRPDDILFICPGALHSLDACPGMRYIFQAEMASVTQLDSVDAFMTLIYPGILITPELYPGSHERIQQLFTEIVTEYHNEPLFFEEAVCAKLMELIVLIRRGLTDQVKGLGASGNKQKEYMEKFMDVCRYINEHCTEELTLDDVAARAGFSKYHFSRLFSQFAKVSFYKYLNQKRIEHAERMLIDPSVSVTEVSLSSGFTSLSSFIRMFKLIKGCTPTEYRAMYNR